MRNCQPRELYYSGSWQEINGLVIEVWEGLRKATRDCKFPGPSDIRNTFKPEGARRRMLKPDESWSNGSQTSGEDLWL